MRKHFIVIVFCLFFGMFNSYSQSDCRNALSVCIDASNDGVVSNYGIDDFFGATQSGCLGTAGAGTIESNSYWFRIKLAQSGQFGFDIIPNDSSEDWDFAVYGPNATCGQLPEPIKCNVQQIAGNTGVGDASALYESWMDVNAGDEYLILVNQYFGNNDGFKINWTGDIFLSTNPVLDCDIQVDLGPDLILCGSEPGYLSALTYSAGNNLIYEWLTYNNSTGLWDPWNPPGNREFERSVTQTGLYRVNVFIMDPSTGVLIDTLTDDVIVTSVPKPIANSLQNDVYGCDDGTGNFDFDLEALSDEIKNGQPNVTVTYYLNEIFAQLHERPESSPFQSSGIKPIWARIENSLNPDCYDLTSFNLIVLPIPIAYEPEPLIFCDTDADGKFIFNLEERTDDILNGQTGLIVSYYTRLTDAELAKFEIFNPNISDPANTPPPASFLNTTNYLSQSKKIWARVEPVLGSDCYAITSFELKVVAPAIAYQPENITRCDDNNDGYYEFDFSTKDAEILGTQSASNFEVNYFATQANAFNNLNALPNPYTNITPYAEETIYVRIQVKGNPACFDLTSFNLQVFDTPYPAVSANIPVLSYCDDASDGDDTNGLYEFDLTERESIILDAQSPYVFDVNYYEDATYTNQIPNPTAYTNTNPNQQTIYVRVTNSNINNVDCYADTSFEIQVKPLPNALTTPFELIQCDEDGTQDGIVNFNLTEADFFVTIGDSSLNVTYHLSAADAASGINEANKFSFSNNISPTVFARVAAVNGCYRIVQVNLIVTSTKFPPNYSREITVCDDDDMIDGLHEFNLAQVTSEIISLFPSPNLRVSYFINQADAVSETNVISPANAYLSEVPFSQPIWVRVESAVNGGCFGIAPVIQLTVNPRPEFELDETDIICLNDLPKTISIKNPLGNYSYEWTDEVGIVISDQPFAAIIEEGVYTVIATSNNGCESFPKQIAVTESIIANISVEDIQIIDNSGNNSITINNSGQNLGIGDYEFALDNISGPYQDSSIFPEVIPGKHIIYVNDKNNCGIAQITVYVFGFPNFFTPNDDSYNDYWNILGVDPAVFKSSSIYIFDRYGKLMTNFSASQKGWDGFYNDRKAISTDYWYLAKIIDYNDVTREYKGHFSLIRR